MTHTTVRLPTGGRLALLLALALTVLAGCGGLLPKPPAPPARFTLDGEATAPAASAAPAASFTTAAGAGGGPTLVVAQPTAAPGFESSRMVYLRTPQALQAFAYHEWVDTPARMLAPLMVRALQDHGAFGVVVQAPTTATGSWRLETELIRLQHDFSTQPSQVRLTLRAVLVDTVTRQPVAWHEFDDRVPAASDNPTGGAAAAAAATQRVLAALAAFVAQQAVRPTAGAGPLQPAAAPR